jgi:tRNA(Arg) A34 adenosine deaminase TadA
MVIIIFQFAPRPYTYLSSNQHPQYFQLAFQTTTIMSLSAGSTTPATAAIDWAEIDARGLRLAIAQAQTSAAQGGIPIGAAILLPAPASQSSKEPDSETKKERYTVLGAGHNARLQKGSAILHGEMSALENAGRLHGAVYRQTTLVSLGSSCVIAHVVLRCLITLLEWDGDQYTTLRWVIYYPRD